MGRRSDIKPLPSLERLNELLSYNEFSGILTWKILSATSRANIGFNNKCGGKVAGTIGAKGYIMIGIDKIYYLAHRVIWKMKTGIDPVDIIDHENTKRSDNRWLNLREAANGSNIQNSKLRKDNSSGIKGVHWDSQHKKWRAVISTNGQSQRLGRFSSIEEAANIISAARLQLHGEFARSN
jgi:hypothetical protein